MNDKLANLYRDSQRETREENEYLREAIGDFLSAFLPWYAKQSKEMRQEFEIAAGAELEHLIDCNNRGQDCQ